MDWTPVVLRKRVEKPTIIQNKPNPEKEKKIKVYSKEFADAVQTSRISKHFSQSDLAKKCNVQVSVINMLELKKGIYDHTVANKVCTVLGIKVNKKFIEI
jgi:ribosome-binding protein aMBF1 (putative translation factor)